MKKLNFLKDVFFLLISKTSSDILVASYPKTGSTLLRKRLVLATTDSSTISHKIVNNRSPEIGHGRIQIGRRSPMIIKTHNWLISGLLNITTILTVRSPFETVASYYEYRCRIGLNGDLTFIEFWRSKMGITLYIKYLEFIKSNKGKSRFIVHDYDKMLEGTENFFAELLMELGVKCD